MRKIEGHIANHVLLHPVDNMPFDIFFGSIVKDPSPYFFPWVNELF